jgi:hypothetical protein
MLELWKLRRERKKVRKLYDRDLNRLQKEKKEEEFNRLFVERGSEIALLDEKIRFHRNIEMLNEAMELDVQVPVFGKKEYWILDQGPVRLSSVGRRYLGELIERENSRVFETKGRWVRLLLLLVTALTGLVGAITGLISVAWR